MNSTNISPEELLHLLNNQLSVVMGHAELIARQSSSQDTTERCLEIKRAVSNIHRLLRTYFVTAA